VVLAVVIAVALMLGRPASVLGLALVGDRFHAVIVEEAAISRRIVQGDLASLVVRAGAGVRVAGRMCRLVVGLVPVACRGAALCRVVPVLLRCVPPDSGIRFGVVSIGALCWVDGGMVCAAATIAMAACCGHAVRRIEIRAVDKQAREMPGPRLRNRWG